MQKLEPWGAIRDDLRAGTIASPLLNIQLSRESKKTNPVDWIMNFLGDNKPSVQTPDDMKAVLQALADVDKMKEIRKKRRAEYEREKARKRKAQTAAPKRKGK